MIKNLFGHRGAAGEAPENTVSGFIYARQAGVRAFELDVRLSADEQLVVIHDDTVDRTTNGSGLVSGFTADQLRALDARAAFPDWPERVGVPTLDEVLDIIHDIPALQLEIKPAAPRTLEEICTRLIAQITNYAIAARTVVTSFSPIALEIMRRNAPEISRGYIGAYNKPEFLDTVLRLGCSDACIHLPSSSKETVAKAQAHNLKVTGWMGNTVAEIRSLLEWKVDNITTDYPSLAMSFLSEFGGEGGETAE